MKHGIHTLDDFDLKGKTILLRVDINSPLTADKAELRDDTRIRACLPTIREIAEKGAKLVLLAHQGGDLEYKNYGSTLPHARRLTELLEKPVEFVDDVCGPYARQRIQSLAEGEIILLENVRLMAEEMTLFETKLKLSPPEQAKTTVVQKLAPLADLYVCDAFAAAHRAQPTLVGFPQLVPSAMGRLFEEELSVLTRVREDPERPCLFILGGAKIQDAFLMMESVLGDGTADLILTGGLLANVMLLASGADLGVASRDYLASQNLLEFLSVASRLLSSYGDRVLLPVDVAVVEGDERQEIDVGALPARGLIVDIGAKTVECYRQQIQRAQTIFINGPFGVFEKSASEYGTREIWAAIAGAPAFSVIGGGDSIAAANKFNLADQFSYVCTAGGGLVRFLAGEELPVVRALRDSAQKFPAAIAGSRC